MATSLSGKQRLWVVIAAAWIALWLVIFAPWREGTYTDPWLQFFVIGVGPVALVLAIIWVRRGFRNERMTK